MKERLKNPIIWIPVGLASVFVVGIFVGSIFFPARQTSDSRSKLENVLGLIDSQYVDEVDIDSLLEAAIPSIVSGLDPHSAYLFGEELKEANDELEGTFSGIGISFQIMSDTVTVVEVIPGGPAEKAGVMAGDRIVTVGDSTFVGKEWNETKVRSTLRGPEGSEVKLGIKRSTSPKTLTFKLKRGQIPVSSVDAAFIIAPKVGYIKVNKFGAKTYSEFLQSLVTLTTEGAESFIIDLRGNGGGFMEPAILMANEFLPANAMIVATKGRLAGYDSATAADGSGNFQNVPLTVLIDEFSASASEIFAGAIQDNDRGTIIGRRSFGKGLVQKQTDLPDGSALRLTVARYYTPSGRCIQKQFTRGHKEDYEGELLKRYDSGELYSADSAKVDRNNVFYTIGGREVFGGGGIMPDVFVANDTTKVTNWYLNVLNAGLFQKYAFKWCDDHRAAIAKMKKVDDLYRILPDDDTLLEDFVSFAHANGVAPRWYYINISRNLIVNYLKALIARDALNLEAFYRVYSEEDEVISRAVQEIQQKK
ncbi:MAG: S41 family peptidase [Muribaculaceae bacterium]|nr:S41 family peptidase [Muribaculaceae bacterium]